MRLSYLYNQAIKLGRLHDPRGNGCWKYADTAILFGKPDVEVKRILVGIDIEMIRKYIKYQEEKERDSEETIH